MAVARGPFACEGACDENAEVLVAFAAHCGLSVPGLLDRAAANPSEMERIVTKILMTGGSGALRGISRERLCRVAVDVLGVPGLCDDAESDCGADEPSAGVSPPRPCDTVLDGSRDSSKVNMTDLFLCGRPDFAGMSRVEIAMLLLQEQGDDIETLADDAHKPRIPSASMGRHVKGHLTGTEPCPTHVAK